MDLRTGEISLFDDEDLKKLKESDEFKFLKMFEKAEATTHQLETMEISKFDSQSILGKNWTKERNNPCPCGSGKKLKKCCLWKLEKASRTINKS